ncbi:MAG: hypothetical protein ACOC97_05130 [Myxococcota bacterium]
MSQFVIFSGPMSWSPRKHWEVGEAAKDPFLRKAYQAIWAGADLALGWTAIGRDGSADDLFTEAQVKLQEQRPFGSTPLGELLYAAAQGGCAIAMWYAHEWSDLPVVRERGELLTCVEQQLLPLPGEVYLAYEPPAVETSGPTAEVLSRGSSR